MTRSNCTQQYVKFWWLGRQITSTLEASIQPWLQPLALLASLYQQPSLPTNTQADMEV